MHKLLTLLVFSLAITGCSSSPPFYGDAPSFIWPVKGGRLTQKFKTGRKKHQGIDIGRYKNAPVRAAADGVVLYAGRHFRGYGKMVILEHRGDKWASFYAHLSRFKVREGQRIRKGQTLGLMGATGRATGVHLHFEIRHNKTPVDPLLFVGSSSNLTMR